MFDSSGLKCYNNSIVFQERKKMIVFANTAIFFGCYYFYFEG